MAFEQFLLRQINLPVAYVPAINANHLNRYEDLLQLTYSTVADYCQNMRRPGGLIADPQNAGGAMPNPGCPIQMVTERRLALAVFAAHYHTLVGRPLTPDNMIWNRFQHFSTFLDIRKNYLAPTDPPEHQSGTSFATTIEIIENHLSITLGATKIPLSYVIRPDPVVPDHTLQPLNPNNTLPFASDTFTGFNEELAARTPHTIPEWNTDNSLVFSILLRVFGKSKYVSSLQPYRTRNDGRAAYLALVQHNLGSNQWQLMFHDAETIVTTHKFYGTNPHYTLSTHIAKHRSAHDRMRRASSHVNFSLPTETTRVLRLLQSLEASNIAILSAKTSILGDDVKRSDFELASDFLITVTPHTNQPRKSQRISSLTSRGGKSRNNNYNNNRGKNGKWKSNKGKSNHRYQPYNNSNHQQHQQNFTPTLNRGSSGVEFRYYTDSDYQQLSHPQRNELRLWRKAQNTPVTIAAIQQYLQHPSPQIVPHPQLPPPPAARVPPPAPAHAIVHFQYPPGQNRPPSPS